MEERDAQRRTTPEGTTQSTRSEHPRRARSWLDTALKLSAPVGVILTAVGTPILVDHFQARNAVLNLESQREQSESSLRAAMFGYLIKPIVGEQNSGNVDPDRYRLLVEMLALNFHENVEFKPLMEDADRRLALGGSGMTSKQADDARGALRTVARRVVDRQLAMLGEEKSSGCSWINSSTVSIDLIIGKTAEITKKTTESFPCERCVRDGDSNTVELARVRKLVAGFYTSPNGPQKPQASPEPIASPDCNDLLAIAFSDPSEENRSVTVQFIANKLKKGQQGDTAAPISFTLTPYNFPFTDNTLLSDGNRFAVYFLGIDPVDENAKSFHLGLRWFPKDYFPPRERPMDFEQFRNKLGIKPGAD